MDILLVAPAINSFIMWGTLFLQVGVVLLAIVLLGVRGTEPIRTFVLKNGMTLSFILALSAMLGSLYYSNIEQFAPCLLCWYQRILFFPQPLLIGIAFMRKTRDVVPYTFILSLIGIVVSLYQVIIERFPSISALCAPSEVSVSCATIYVEGFSYITIPVMGLTMFTALALVAYTMLKERKEPMLDVVK